MRSHLSGRQTGAFAPHISSRDLESFTLSLPPLPEQHRIVDLMGAVDAYVATADARVEAARTARTALLTDLLSTPGEDWVETTVEEQFEVLDRMRRPIKESDRIARAGDVPYFGATGQVGWIDDHIFDEPLVLLGEDGVDFENPLKAKAYVIAGRSWVNNHAHVLRPRASLVNSLFGRDLLNLVDYSKYVVFGTRSKLTQASMRKIRFSLPPLPEQHRIVNLMSAVDREVETSKKVAAEARTLRTALLTDLLSGTHEIPTSYDRFLVAA